MTRRDKTAYMLTALMIVASLALLVPTAFRGNHVNEGKIISSLPALPILPDAAAGNSDRYSSLSGRPVFVSARRPLPATVSVMPAAAAPAPVSLTLLGVMIKEDDRVALVKRLNGTETIILHEGQSLDGWTLEQIDSDRAVLQAGSSRQTLFFPDRGKNEESSP